MTAKIIATDGIVASQYSLPDGSPSVVELGLKLRANLEFYMLEERVTELEQFQNDIKSLHELHEKYPALKEAFEAYNILLKLVKSNEQF